MVPANGAFRGVFVMPGERVVEFVYEPASFRAGALISALALAATMLLAFSSLWQRQRAASEMAPAPIPDPMSEHAHVVPAAGRLPAAVVAVILVICFLRWRR